MTNMYLRYAGTLDIFAKALKHSEAMEIEQEKKTPKHIQIGRERKETVGKTRAENKVSSEWAA